MLDLKEIPLDQLIHFAEQSATATDVELEMARRLRLKEVALKWIVDKYMPEEGSGCDSRGVDDFCVVATAGLSDVEIGPYVAPERVAGSEITVEYI